MTTLLDPDALPPPVNLDNVRDMLGNDPARERELFQIYIESAEECLEGLKTSCGAGAEDNWRTQAHALKGMSLNLGAEKLGQLCAEAQKNNTAPPADREATLIAIQKAYDEVKQYLQSVMQTTDSSSS